MSLEFKDYFSENSESYRKYHPQYPLKLFAYLSSISPSNKKAWDCATGTGQSARSLNKFFNEVVATDASRSQIEKAKKENGITYLVSPAEKTEIGNRKIDIITVAQALHWFNINDFFKEAKRVLKANGILAVWSYNLLKITPDLDKIINHFSSKTLGKYWPKERKLVEEEYRRIDFPFKKVHPPSFEMEAEWNLNQLIGYLCTWSAVKKYQKNKGINPLTELHEELSILWRNAENRFVVKWPLSLKIRQKNT